ncbi:hypothetical protein D3C86_1777840 [compost metagenome]
MAIIINARLSTVRLLLTSVNTSGMTYVAKNSKCSWFSSVTPEIAQLIDHPPLKLLASNQRITAPRKMKKTLTRKTKFLTLKSAINVVASRATTALQRLDRNAPS